MPGIGWLCVPGALLLVFSAGAPGQAHMYNENDSLVSLASGARPLLLNSSSAWVGQFFASWCGHCQQFRANWVTLARDVKDWRPAVYLAVLDCGDESNSPICTDFDIKGYPTVKFFNAFSKSPSDGINLSTRNPYEIRKIIIDELEAQKESPPPACPPLEPISAPEVDPFFENNAETYLMLIFENFGMYMAREVALDMVQYEGVSVRRVLEQQSDLVDKFQVSSFPSGFLLSRNGSLSKTNLKEESRAEYTKFLRSLPGVNQVKVPLIGWSASTEDTVVKRPVNSSVVYMADLESSIHYSLRVEVARFTSLEGERLKALTSYVTVLKKYFPARPFLQTLLDSLYTWLNSQSGKMVSYKDFADVLNNKNQDQDAVLAPHVNYVWCQGSKPEFRGFPCSVWTLFHLLTVSASEKGLDHRDSYPQEVLQTMRHYVQYFFGCRNCAQHFEIMAKESMRSVRSLDDAIRWLWLSHNRVNKRLAGQPSDDPEFPKIQWPSKELCPTCRRKLGNEEIWDRLAVLRFMKLYFSESNLSYEYLEKESVLLENQKKAADVVRAKREANGEEKEQEKQSRNDVMSTPMKTEDNIDLPAISEGNQNPRHRPTIIKMKSNRPFQRAGEDEEKILDLDSYENHFFPRRTLEDSSFHQNKRALHPERLLDPPDAEFDEAAVRDRLIKKGIDTKYLIGVMVENGEINWKGRWVKMLEVGFSRLDISLCVILYFLTSMCLLAMYLYLSFRTRFLRQRCSYPQA